MPWMLLTFWHFNIFNFKFSNSERTDRKIESFNLQYTSRLRSTQSQYYVRCVITRIVIMYARREGVWKSRESSQSHFTRVWVFLGFLYIVPRFRHFLFFPVSFGASPRLSGEKDEDARWQRNFAARTRHGERIKRLSFAVWPRLKIRRLATSSPGFTFTSVRELPESDRRSLYVCTPASKE